jgi:hypothetical protein
VGTSNEKAQVKKRKARQAYLVTIANGLDRKITGIDRLEAEPNAMCAIGS